MWVTQTYLHNAEPKASVFVYYLFEDYNDQQLSFTETVQNKLAELGDVFNDKVSLLMPNPQYAARIGGEVHNKITDLWWSLEGKLPGLLVTTKSLSDFDGRSGDYSYVPLPLNDVDGAILAISVVRRLAFEQLSWNHAHPNPIVAPNILDRFWDSIEFKPGFGPFKIDILKLLQR